MKTMRKLLALALALTMVLAMATAASAATVTVDGALPGVTYKAYKLATVEVSGDGESRSYVSVADWKEFFTTNNTYFNTIENGDALIVTPVQNLSETDKKAIVDAAESYAATNNIGATATTTGEQAEGATSASATFNNLDNGYYLMTSSGGSLSTLHTVVGDNDTLQEKNKSLPNIEKKVNGEESVSASIGETVTFTLTVNTGNNENNDRKYVIHDNMDAGLTLVENTIVVKYTPENGAETDLPADAYTVTKNCTDGCDFEIIFTEELSTNAGDVITVTYNATVNSGANPENTNTAAIYQNDAKMDQDDAAVKTYQFTLSKVDGEGAGAKALDGAEFKLYKDSGCTQEIALVQVGTAYRVAVVGETAATLTAGTNVEVKGLAVGTYYLKETKAPEGYVLATEAKAIDITENTENNNVDVNFVNVKGDELPETGGMGTTLFYVVGGMMVCAAAVLLVTKKRMSAE